MSEIKLQPASTGIKGTLSVPGDKSISHRSIIFSALAEGTSHISNFLTGEDCLRTVQAFREFGVEIKQEGTNVTVQGKGLDALRAPVNPIYFGNSGTTARLMSGVLSALPLFSTAYGDPSLSKRPMDRVVEPLSEMGAEITGREKGKFLPLAFNGQKLRGATIEMKVKSAQVKSALLLAGMLAEGETVIYEKGITRNHTEMLMSQYGISLDKQGNKLTISGNQQPQASNLTVPGDISSAAFFIVAAAITPNSSISIENVGLNPTRDGIITALKKMGAHIEVDQVEKVGHEPVGRVYVKTSELKGCTFEGELIPNLIDEIPILALAATQAEGTTYIKDAKELRVKETDRIEAVVTNLRKLGAEVEPTEDGMIISGKNKLTGGSVDSYGDHRIGMMGAIASLITEGTVLIQDKECINISYPNFFDHLKKVCK
ncbi:3-phosphoshikimate 1-carboxyvinyltransferase [Halobacillus andaensis]|uniref:3-phosphoshikimate 1-carboxyvinyltransferase n=1 Tax=Halobacillus andaensis TaxID=1176239 RepID=A0A917AY51_HALAA|nr:3-phosphoshikimate 1-carboxyvinyltransferase [Halobacillus andaensis]MBP2003275.1 3-phosphoshikimate 1-carboxyvinyltransferase [Halobacillus andaensis]GGF09444.1 3-phosphoshikimate 1-carboxyvinyltransferase [Halobacillus andaensis]